ncbi:MAG TPA: protein kinase, partial [Oscillatoriaceae cyanobacterium]
MSQSLAGELVANRYKIVAELGRGAMGAVYRALDSLKPGQEVALKRIAVASGITPELALMFKEEFRAMAKLRHPNTIAVHDFGQLDHTTNYLTMELVDGQALDELADGKPMPLERVYSILVQLLQALEFIHSRLYVHRDIKSQNIRIKPDGTLKLMDFGLMSQLGLPTKGGTLRGSPGYVAPEVIRGGVIDAGTDLYAVGCLAYELLTGRLPFTGGLMTVVRAHVSERPEPMSRHRTEVPAALEHVVMKLMEKDQTRRYRSAAAVIEDLAPIAGVAVTRRNVDQKKSYLTSVGLVAREMELAQLTAGLEACRKGHATSIYIGAPAGVGKSRLAQEGLLLATLSEIPVAFGQSLESGMAPYEPLVHALRPLLPLTSDSEIADQGPVLAHLFPELAARGFVPAAVVDSQSEKLAIHDALVAWLKKLTARQPIVWCMDDLHWADPSSLEAFNYCQAALRESALLAIATFRNDEVGPGSPLWYPIEEGTAQYVELRPFREAEIDALVRAMLHDVQVTPAFMNFLYDATAGNAFFLTEVLRYLIEEEILTQREGRWHFPAETAGIVIPGSVEATVLRRLRLLGDRARELAGVAAVLGRFQDREMLRAVGDLDDETLFQLVEELIAGQFLINEGQHYTFPHDRVREALYADVPAERRRTLHERCGEFLEGGNHGTLDQRINELAYHFGRGCDLAKAYTYLRRAGDDAARLGLTGSAITYWKEAEQALATLDLPNKEAMQVEIWHLIGTQAFDFWPELAIEAFTKELVALEACADADAISEAVKREVAELERLPVAERAAALAILAEDAPYRHDPSSALDPGSWLSRVVETYAFLCAAYGFAGKPEKGFRAIERARALLP